MLHIALWEPEIPPNTGNIARMCAATATRLHLIGSLGFRLDDRALKRAGCDYWPAVDVVMHATFADFEAIIDPTQLWLVENPAPRRYTQATFRDGDCLLFGNESRGLPMTIRERYADRMIDIPMTTDAVRSLNLATSAGIVLYEALRQTQNW
ncbi:tRNA (cytidine(34)-2'-O)-methyltransferase [Tuwongella immobilis]|uniref:Putative tRNA (cytidine(34)-2'-O)-methyltransferase n=1 Tax=Tuwongella immobilis TaxID=692036 RepID=A0A6C2YI30_9BACT|nr:tRNA (cytidine(34)-2'-O)-methyltransferase [Tuwongella immobilis]VIP01024.1 trna methyltransferase : tRNA (cytidine(34)-2'-O)-methyltransferase OS=Desulfuromonas acetoxidans DSM 684 GN=trmL PE=3 SV=1: SpoU_methylase [Tuwongella immobilis]VTR97473.1 trna methyltransferase : tRNA (cytidine(34)-2'-O)-methyltransferase OS=Desulfuromonas acetoxidans DSM 684 GN=trmL PE=3 SV=1: SpoU_methylase [Tuwongella immobilis]